MIMIITSVVVVLVAVVVVVVVVSVAFVVSSLSNVLLCDPTHSAASGNVMPKNACDRHSVYISIPVPRM